MISKGAPGVAVAVFVKGGGRVMVAVFVGEVGVGELSLCGEGVEANGVGRSPSAAASMRFRNCPF